MRRQPDAPYSLMTSRWWTPVCMAAIAGWVAATWVGASVWPGGEPGGRYGFVAYGAVFFGALFGYALWTTRRWQTRARSELYERLALTPVPPDTLRASTQGLYRIGYVYFAAGMIVTGLGLAAVAVYGTPWEARLIQAAIGIVVLWFAYMLYALRTIPRVSDVQFAPLGLTLAAMPIYRVSPFHGIRTMEGTVTYGGRRHGREVSIAIGIGASGTVVSGPAGTSRPPTSPRQMASLTGERPSHWRNVTVAIADGRVVVERTGRDCGRWFLHDLLLAEAVAGPLPPPD
jgi:hypothetical protein